MIVSKIDHFLYEVKEAKGSKAWWTASNRTGHWFIMTGNSMRSVNPDGRVGKRIVAAVEAYLENRKAMSAFAKDLPEVK